MPPTPPPIPPKPIVKPGPSPSTVPEPALPERPQVLNAAGSVRIIDESKGGFPKIVAYVLACLFTIAVLLIFYFALSAWQANSLTDDFNGTISALEIELTACKDNLSAANENISALELDIADYEAEFLQLKAQTELSNQ